MRVSEPRPLNLHILRVVPVVIVLGLLVHFLLPRIDTIESSLKTMRTLAPWAIGMALVFEALSYVANGALLESVIGLAGEHMPFRRAAAIEIGAGTVSIVAAGALGFGAAIYRWTRNSGVAQDAAMLAGWLPSVFDSASLMIFALLGGIELLLHHQLSRTTTIALIVVISMLALIIATTIVLLVRNDWLMAIASRAARRIKRIRPSFDESALTDMTERAADTWHMLQRGGWWRPASCSLMVLAFDLLCLRYAFLAAGQHPHFSLLLAGYGVPLLLGRASFLPGGLAVVEVGMAALFGGLGIAASAAVVAVLTYRLISFWLPTLIGIPIAITLESRRRR